MTNTYPARPCDFDLSETESSKYPLLSTFGKFEAEAVALLYILYCKDSGNAWVPATLMQLLYTRELHDIKIHLDFFPEGWYLMTEEYTWFVEVEGGYQASVAFVQRLVDKLSMSGRYLRVA